MLLAAVAAAVALKNQTSNRTNHPSSAAPAVTGQAPAGKAAEQPQLPRLLDLGATKCIPCKMMEPVLEELRNEYKGKLTVEFIDVWENRDASTQYGVQAIPTQIFFDKHGNEFFRHEGFLSKDAILKVFRDKGIEL